MDMDIDHQHGAEAAREDLARAVAADLSDHFARLECTVGGTLFETLQVDVTVTPPAQWEVEAALRPGLLTDIGLGPIDVLLVPLERQVAEKLHAYTRPYDSGGSTRVKNLVDFVIIRPFERLDADRLRDAINETFSRRGNPPRAPPAPAATG